MNSSAHNFKKLLQRAGAALTILFFGLALSVYVSIAQAAETNVSSSQLDSGAQNSSETAVSSNKLTAGGSQTDTTNDTTGTKTGPGDGTYQLLVPLPEFGEAVQTTDFAKFLNQIIRLCIIFAGVLAVVKISIGGLKYMTTDSMNSKSEGKGEIIGAIFGLVVLAASYLILNTINPALLNLQLNVPNSGTIKPADTSSDSAQNNNSVVQDGQNIIRNEAAIQATKDVANGTDTNPNQAVLMTVVDKKTGVPFRYGKTAQPYTGPDAVATCQKNADTKNAGDDGYFYACVNRN